MQYDSSRGEENCKKKSFITLKLLISQPMFVKTFLRVSTNIIYPRNYEFSFQFNLRNFLIFYSPRTYLKNQICKFLFLFEKLKKKYRTC